MEIQTAIPVLLLFCTDPLNFRFTWNIRKSYQILVTWVPILHSSVGRSERVIIPCKMLLWITLHSKWEQTVMGKNYIPFGMFSSYIWETRKICINYKTYTKHLRKCFKLNLFFFYCSQMTIWHLDFYVLTTFRTALFNYWIFLH